MRAYLAVTAALFGVLTVIHGWRMVVERSGQAAEPWFLGITVLSAILCGWGIRLFLAARTSPTT